MEPSSSNCSVEENVSAKEEDNTKEERLGEDIQNTESLTEKLAATTECLDDETWGESPREVNPVQKGASGSKERPQSGAARTRAFRERQQKKRAAQEAQKKEENRLRTAASRLKKKEELAAKEVQKKVQNRIKRARYCEAHPEEVKDQSCHSSAKWRKTHLEEGRQQDRERKKQKAEKAEDLPSPKNAGRSL